MRIIHVKDYDALSKKAAEIIAAQVILKPDCVLGLATGSSPIGTYQRLIAKHENDGLDFSQVKTVNLDEYVGLDASNDQSYAYFMQHTFFKHINIVQANTHIPMGSNQDAVEECSRYDALIQTLGGIDLQLLGLGPNGHIGFNEPNSHFSLGTHCVQLSEATIQANQRFFERKEDVPRYAYTMGIREIMQARKVLLIVSGNSKADIARHAFYGPVTSEVPASILQLHPDFTLIGDKAALQGLATVAAIA